MKIIHCADIHLDSALTTHLDKNRARIRRKEILDTFRRMLVYASDNGVQAVIIAGDLFDSETVSSATVRIVLGEIKKRRNLEVYYLSGNHDPGFEIFAGVELPENLHLFESKWTYYILNEDLSNGDNLAEGDKRNIVLAGVVMTPDNIDSIYDDLDLREDDINIVTLHGQEQKNGKKSSANAVYLERLTDKGIDYLALGHVHKPKQDILDHRGIYVYSGCLEGRGFDECGDHGFILLDIDERSGKVRYEFVPFARRRLYEIVVDISGVSDNHEAADMIADQLYRELNDKKEENMENALVKIILTGEIDVESELDIEYLTGQFMDSFYYVKVVNGTKLKVNPIKYMHDATLRGEFVRLVMAQDMSEEDKAFVIRTGIRALAGEEVWPG